MFAGAYILVLCLSTGLAAWFVATAAGRTAAMLKQEQRLSHGTTTALSAIAFLVVVSAPSPVMVCALFLLLAGFLHAKHYYVKFFRFAAPVLAVALGLTGLAFTPLPDLSVPAIIGLAGLGWLVVTLSGEWLPENFTPTAFTVIAGLLPLLASHWLNGPGWIALDVAIIIAALAGAVIAAGHHALSGIARIALAYLVGWLVLEAALHQAWIPALASLTIWFCALGYAYSQDPSRYNRAFDF